MTASKYIKSQGLPSVAYVADKVGKHRDTINNWYHNNYALFEVVVAGVKARQLIDRAKGEWFCAAYDMCIIIDDNIRIETGIERLMRGRSNITHGETQKKYNAELRKMVDDAVARGNVFIKDGKRIDPDNLIKQGKEQ